MAAVSLRMHLTSLTRRRKVTISHSMAKTTLRIKFAILPRGTWTLALTPNPMPIIFAQANHTDHRKNSLPQKWSCPLKSPWLSQANCQVSGLYQLFSKRGETAGLNSWTPKPDDLGLSIFKNNNKF